VDALGKDRHALVGHLMYAVMRAEKDDDYQELIDLFVMLMDQQREAQIREQLEGGVRL